jgi:hypothetical protein
MSPVAGAQVCFTLVKKKKKKKKKGIWCKVGAIFVIP